MSTIQVLAADVDAAVDALVTAAEAYYAEAETLDNAYRVTQFHGLYKTYAPHPHFRYAKSKVRHVVDMALTKAEGSRPAYDALATDHPE